MGEPNVVPGWWRVGRKLGRTIYEQVGPEPSYKDRFLGIMDDVEVATMVVVNHNRCLLLDYEAMGLFREPVPPGRNRELRPKDGPES